MKKQLVIGALIAAFLVPVSPISLLAQEIKIGYIDSIKIFAEYKETQEAERMYKREVDQWTADKNRMEQEIVKLRDELAAQSLMLSEEKKKEKELELKRRMDEYEGFMKETFGDEGLAAKRNQELTQPIVDKINQVLEELAKEMGYLMIFDVANADIVYADKSLDLTEVVLQRLGQQ